MAEIGRVGRSSLMATGATMLFLGITHFVLGSLMANPAFENSCYAIAVLLTVFCLLINGVYYGIQVRRETHRSEFAAYSIASSLSVACWLIFWLIQSAPGEIRLLDFLAGIQGLFWGLWYIRLAFRIQTSYTKAALLCTLAATTSFLGIILATQSHVSKLASVTEVACYTAFIGVQILFTAIYLFRECGASHELQHKSVHARSSFAATEDAKVLLVKQINAPYNIQQDLMEI